jgi:Arc/MetJ-type ribon-helix-helix transcriptional regulator
MVVVQVELPEDPKQTIDRQVAEGRVASHARYVEEALRGYADYLDAEGEIAGMVERADADIAAGRYVMVETSEQSQALHEAAMDRVRARLALAHGRTFLARAVRRMRRNADC